MTNKRILVFGATGYTGRLIVKELAHQNLPMAMAGRNLQALEKLQTELQLKDTPLLIGDPTDPTSLKNLFQADIGVIINCVGPFTTFGENVVKAALEAGVHYLDITGEQAYLAHILTTYDKLAREAGCAIVPACGVEYALSNWVAALACENLEPIEELWTATAIQNVKASRGTQLSLFEALAQPGIGWKDGRRTLRLTASQVRTVDFPAPFGKRRAVLAPLGEVVTLPRHLDIKNMQSYLALPNYLTYLLPLLSPLLPILAKGVGKFVSLSARNPHHEEVSEWAIVASAKNKQGRGRWVSLQGRNVYALTAIITTWCAAHMLESDFNKVGGLGPAQAFEAREAVAYLQTVGCGLNEQVL